MIIKNIKLNNIRSYTGAVVDFPKSSVLLSGDIGSGKSTVLLALEFALFGLSKKELSGDALLRKGKTKGAVEVALNINNKDIIIKRTLKKSGDKIMQNSGYIIEDDVKKEGTAVELKSRIISMLGYPKEALTKKTLIYKYTVYTPQEEMKRIILDEKSYRMDTLRKVFGIDKYKTIRENTTVFLRSMREKLSRYKGQVEDLDILKTEFKEVNEKTQELKKQINEIKPKHEQAKKLMEQQKQKLSALEEEGRKKQELLSRLAVNEAKLKEKVEQRKRNNKEIELIEMRTDELTKELDNLKIEKPKMSVKEINALIDEKQKQLLELVYAIKDIELKQKTFKEEKKQILKLSKCPTCKQEVSADYKEKFTDMHDADLEELEKKFNELSIVKKEKNQHIERMKTDSYNTYRKEKECALLMNNKKHVISTLEEIKIKKIELEKSQVSIKDQIGKINLNVMELDEQLKNFKEIDLEKQKLLLDELRDKFHNFELRKVELEKENKMI
jgi:exonuclease SbcC